MVCATRRCLTATVSAPTTFVTAPATTVNTGWPWPCTKDWSAPSQVPYHKKRAIPLSAGDRGPPVIREVRVRHGDHCHL